MTISYSGSFYRILGHWKGSLWKSVWKELIVFLVLHYAIGLTYRFLMAEEQKRVFEKVSTYFDDTTKQVPLTFVLGFYVYQVFTRWWEQFNYISWPDRFCMQIAALLGGTSDEMRMIRRTMARYCNLTSVLAWRGISSRVLKRFPTEKHCVETGLMTHAEHELYMSADGPHGKYFVPLIWIANILHDLKAGGSISDITLTTLMQELEKYRIGFGSLMCYNWVTVPLVYTQLVTIFVYGYFCLCLVGRHFLDPSQKIPGNEIDYWFPFFTVIQFLMYMGWLRVGEDLIDPFGEDDDDFELNYILDRNVQVAYMMVDSLAGQRPPIVRDAHWDIQNPLILHTQASIQIQENVFGGHLVGFTDSLTQADMEIIEPQKDENDNLTLTPRKGDRSPRKLPAPSLFNRRAAEEFNKKLRRQQRRGGGGRRHDTDDPPPPLNDSLDSERSYNNQDEDFPQSVAVHWRDLAENLDPESGPRGPLLKGLDLTKSNMSVRD